MPLIISAACVEPPDKLFLSDLLSFAAFVRRGAVIISGCAVPEGSAAYEGAAWGVTEARRVCLGEGSVAE